MVIARRPLWQDLVELEPGRFQATEVAWDPEKKEWFGVFGAEERNPGEWGHWTGRGMNWNSMCARCHVTAYAKNYDPATDQYHSRWLEHGIGCVQCHGPLPVHDEHHALPANSDPMLGDRARATETCAACHNRGESLTPEAPVPGARFDDQFRLQLPVDPGLYYPDGQIRDEDFVYGSFRHSRMGAAGVTCFDCHEPHSGATRLPVKNNLLCLQCHATGGTLHAPVIDPTAHSHHGPESTGNRCVECHMVETTYMQRDPRRDHGFIVPDPALSRELGVPNACSHCHADQTLDWNISHYEDGTATGCAAPAIGPAPGRWPPPTPANHRRCDRCWNCSARKQSRPGARACSRSLIGWRPATRLFWLRRGRRSAMRMRWSARRRCGRSLPIRPRHRCSMLRSRIPCGWCGWMPRGSVAAAAV